MTTQTQEEQELDLRAYGRLLLARWWIIALGLIAGLVIGFTFGHSAKPTYQATTKVLLTTSQASSANLSNIDAARELALSYADLITTRPYLQQVIDDLALPYGTAALGGEISITTQNSLILITVTGDEPKRTADIANEAATVFIQGFRDAQLNTIAQTQNSLGQYGIQQDPSIVASQLANMDSLSQVETAIPPTQPLASRSKANIALAGSLGVLAALALIFAMEYLDTSVKSTDELTRLTGLTCLASVARYRVRPNSSEPVFADQTGSGLLREAYRYLYTNLEYASLATGKMHVLLVTSAKPGEGKTTTATNLARTIANSGKSVILVDADLRRPSIGKELALTSAKGLSTYLLGEATIDEILQPVADTPLLQVVVSGPMPPDPTPGLRSAKMREFVDSLKPRADLVILDSPPILAVTDPLILAALADAIVLVVEPRTAKAAVKAAITNFSRSGRPVLGTILNKASLNGNGHGEYYYHYYYAYGQAYQTPNGTTNGNGNGHSNGRTNGAKGKKPAASSSRDS